MRSKDKQSFEDAIKYVIKKERKFLEKVGRL